MCKLYVGIQVCLKGVPFTYITGSLDNVSKNDSLQWKCCEITKALLKPKTTLYMIIGGDCLPALPCV